MTYSVVWSVFALQGLTRLEQEASYPVRIRDSVARIDWALRRTPRDMGESRDPGIRLWYEDVLGVYYRIDEEALQVEVLYVGPSRRH